MAGPMAGLREIAAKADVSITTVSRVLRNQGEISEKTRQRVLLIAEEMRYRPNLPAQSIYSGSTNTVGVIIPAAEDFDMRIILGIHNELARHNHVPITLWASDNSGHGEDMELIRQIHNLVDRRVDGVILRPTIDARDTYIREITNRNLSLVTVDRDLFSSHADFVGTDDFMGARLATEHLLAMGHRRLAHLAGSPQSTTARMRRKSFEETVAAHPDVTWQVYEDPAFGVDLRLDMEIAMKLLISEPRPTAVFAANDKMAHSVYKAARRLGLHIPRDLSVLGFADLEFAEMMDPPLTTIRQHPYEMGVYAARLLLRRSSGEISETEPQRILLKPKLVIRDSVVKRDI